MARVRPLSGFPEWTPADRVVEAQVIDSLKEVFRLHGFAEIETRVVETLDRLAGKSDAAKEIYTLGRLGAEQDSEAKAGLHFDLTVPFARYTEEFQNDLAFPFRRFQIQKVWRGERPQEGRYREFYQADIDIVGRDNLPAHLEVEVAVVMARALASLPLPAVTMHVNNRQARRRFLPRRGHRGRRWCAPKRRQGSTRSAPTGCALSSPRRASPSRRPMQSWRLARISATDGSFATAIEDLWATTTTIEDVADAQEQAQRRHRGPGGAGRGCERGRAGYRGGGPADRTRTRLLHGLGL
ncbi:ATP phosphoribosyltransferase regulatory subunit [Demequina litorisediminis]